MFWLGGFLFELGPFFRIVLFLNGYKLLLVDREV